MDQEVNHDELLVESHRSCLVAPAGCGKTEVIAKAVARSEKQDRRQLILTHTHAGVDALRRRLKKLKVPTNRFHVDTIAGWALRYANAFPKLTGSNNSRPLAEQWDGVYRSTTHLLTNAVIKRVVEASYCGMYVDEYQDCTKTMHALILGLAEIVPCRILGDPLQGIFGFGKSEALVDWDEDVCPSFSMLPELSYGWRWEEFNIPLGRWLLEVRARLEKGESIDLRKAPRGVEWRRLPDARFRVLERVETCRAFADIDGSVVAIFRWPAECHLIAARLNGIFQSIEPVESSDLLNATDQIFSTSGADRARALVDFCGKCMTKVKRELKSACNVVATGKVQKRRYKHHDQLHALLKVSGDGSGSLLSTLDALLAVRKVPGTVLYRKELFDAMCQTIREYESENHEDLREAALALRNRLRRGGRIPFRRVITRTLLVKGLEYDHAVILDADALDVRNLYVAMTRGRKSLTILSKRPILSPSA